MPLRLIVVVLMAALAVAGCGRRGALEPPPGAEGVREVPKPGEFPDRSRRDDDKPFVLDGLL